MRRLGLLFSIFTFLLLHSLNAQRPDRGGQRPNLTPGTGALAGMVADAVTQEPVAFANVIAYAAGTSEMKDGTTTNENGRFFIKDLPYGTYDVVISFVGYADLKKESISTDEESRIGRVGRVFLEQGNQLEEVEVTAEKNEITFGLDKKTFSVEKQITATGGTAEDVLRNIPSVTFDNDGNVSLRGTSNIRILVNGKPSALTSGGANTVLQQIPASSIKDVEILTNPNAKYDPDGMGGIINIITKRQNKAGFNLQTALNIGTRNKYDGSINLNWRVGKFNTFFNYGGRYGEYFRERTSNRTQAQGDSTFTRNSYFRSETTRISHNIRGGAEYFFSPKTSLTGSVAVSPSSRTGAGRGEGEFINEVGILTDTSVETDRDDETETDIEYDLNFNKRFQVEGRELTVSARYSESEEIENESSNEDFFDLNGVNYNFFGNNSMTVETQYNLRTKIDYVHPFENDHKLETGYQTSLQHTDNDYMYEGLDEVSRTYDLSNRFIYDEEIHSLYAIFSGEKGKLKYSGGLRAEQAYITATLADGGSEPFLNPYFRLYPSGSVSYAMSESTALQVSYSRRVNRPRSRALNPFIQVRDSLNFRQGNPELLPEFINSFELNYLTYTEKGTFSTGLYFRQTNDIISRLQDFDPQTGITTSTWVNLTSGKSYGIEIVGTYRPAKRVRLSANTNIYRSVIDGNNIETDLSNAGYLASGRVAINVGFAKDFDLQISSFFRSRGVSVQGTYAPIYSMDIALKKEVLKGKGAVTFRISDPLNTRDFEIDIDRPGLQQYFKFKRESRIAFLGFTYSLRKEKRRRGQRGERGERGGGDDMDF